MDVVYLAVAALIWLVLIGMAIGCAKLEGPRS